jgi:sterol desaturase/sphingolipid hydroxylase (fatty acid hydroxylase superfamily)
MLDILDMFDIYVREVLNLLYLGVFFFFLVLLVKKKEAFEAIRSAAEATFFNFSFMMINIIMLPFVLPLLPEFLNLGYSGGFFLYESLPPLVVIVIAVFAGDFIGYWRHRLEHTRFLWPSHSIHHSDAHMTWLTLQRMHPFNRLSTYIIDTAFLILLGLPPYAIIANNIVRHYYGYFIHADLPWDYGRWGFVFVSPIMHRWHHAEERAAHNTNFATIFSFFDRVFGTYRVPGRCDVPLGVSSMKNNNVLMQLAYPFKFSSYFGEEKKKGSE